MLIRQWSVLVGLAILLAVPLAASGCGEKLAEKAVEKAIESDSGNGSNVSVDIDKGAGSVKVSSGDGSAEFGQDVKLPAGFPEIGLPDDAKLTVAIGSGGKDGYQVVFFSKKTPKEVYEKIVDTLTAKGYTFATKNLFSEAGTDGFTILASDAKQSVQVMGGGEKNADGNGYSAVVAPK